MKSAKITRRRFIGSVIAAATAPMWLPDTAKGANNRVTMGFIGIGKMGEGHLRRLSGDQQVEILAIAEVYKMFRDLGVGIVEAARKERGAQGKTCQGYNDFRELLARRDIDAVLIATPDHWHATPVIEAARAGKDIYCEKPLSLTIHEARQMVNAVRRYGRVFQTGSQQRSSENFRYACELVRNGYIGDVKTVHVNVGGPSVECDLPAQPVPEGLDWNMWLGPAPERPFHEELRPPHNNIFPHWRSYRDYSGGGMTDWGAHHFDIAQWGLGMDESGPVEIAPPNGKDVLDLTYTYANGVRMFRAGNADGQRVNGVLFTGTKGRIEVNRGYLKSWPDSVIQTRLSSGDARLYRSSSHQQNFLDCVRARRVPICDVETGCRSVTVCHLGNIAYLLGRPLKWDPVKEQFAGDDEANRLLDRPRREPWRL